MLQNQQMTTSYQRRRGPKPGSTAIPFMITVLISLVVFGSVALYFYQKLTAKSKELQTMQSTTTSISEDDISSILFLLDPDDDTKKNAVMMLHFDPVRKKIFCHGIRVDMPVVYDGKSMTVDTCYVNHGMEALKTAISELLDQPIAHYIKMDSTGFQKTVNLIGNVTYRIPIRDTGLKPIEGDEGEMQVTLDNPQFETLLTSSNYSDEGERSTVIGDSVASLLNQCIGGGDVPSTLGSRKGEGGARIAMNLDSYFNTMFNAVTTDITVMDFSNHRHAISYMFQYSSAPALGSGVPVEPLPDGSITLHSAWQNSLKLMFCQQTQSDSNDDENSDKASE